MSLQAIKESGPVKVTLVKKERTLRANMRAFAYLAEKFGSVAEADKAFWSLFRREKKDTELNGETVQFEVPSISEVLTFEAFQTIIHFTDALLIGGEKTEDREVFLDIEKEEYQPLLFALVEALGIALPKPEDAPAGAKSEGSSDPT